MNEYKQVVPAVYDSKKKTIRVAENREVLYGPFVESRIFGLNIITEMLNELRAGSLSGFQYTKDYPERNSITHNDATLAGPSPHSDRVDNLVQGPVEILNGEWYLGSFTDTEFPGNGVYPIYIFEIPKPAENDGVIANDYFRTKELRNGTKQYHYEGTVYRTSDSSKIILASQTRYVGTGGMATYPDPVNPSPTDVVKAGFWFIPRKLIAGEVPKKVIKTASSRVLSGPGYLEATKNSLFYIS